MQVRNLNHNFQTTALGYGCMGLSHAYGEALPEKEAINVLLRAVDFGYKLFDTAEVYGTQEDAHHNENLLGKAFKKIRDTVQIISKFGLSFDFTQIPHVLVHDSRPSTIRKSIEGTLQRLKTDHIDLYYQHRIDPKVEPETVAQVMDDLIREGKILAWGISEANETYLRRAHAITPVTSVENRYHMMAREYESLFPTLEELGIGFMPFSPLANGFLTGQYDKNSKFDEKTDYRAHMPQFKPEAIDKNQSLLDYLKVLAAQKNATLSQISLAWMLNKKPWIVPIPGSRNITRIEENAKATDIVLTNNEIKTIDKALDNMEISEVFGVNKHQNA